MLANGGSIPSTATFDTQGIKNNRLYLSRNNWFIYDNMFSDAPGVS